MSSTSYSSVSTLINNFVKSKYVAQGKKVLIQKINISIWFYCMKKTTTCLIEDKRKDMSQRAHTLKRHMPLVHIVAGIPHKESCLSIFKLVHSKLYIVLSSYSIIQHLSPTGFF